MKKPLSQIEEDFRIFHEGIYSYDGIEFGTDYKKINVILGPSSFGLFFISQTPAILYINEFFLKTSVQNLIFKRPNKILNDIKNYVMERYDMPHTGFEMRYNFSACKSPNYDDDQLVYLR